MSRLRIVGALALIATVIAPVVGAALVYFGAYNISATEPHWRITVWLLDQGMRGSVRQRAADVVTPLAMESQDIAVGAAIYREHCETCHGGPGVPPEPFALGMVPLPANLTYTAREWPAGQLFWVVKHGIKMTGMPAWEYRLDDQEIWSVVSFLKAMVRLSPVEYARLEPPAGDAVGKEPLAGRRPDAARGKNAIHQYGCPTCHIIPGVGGLQAPVGPPLTGIARRQFIAGVLPNTFDNMVAWLLAPQEIDPLTAMPPLYLSRRDAADIAAYLATLD